MRAAVALLAVLPAIAQAEFFSGSDLLRRMDAHDRIDRNAAQNGDWQDAAMANGFVVGVYDVLVDATFCARPGVTVGQVRRVAHAYIRALPHRHHEPAYLLVQESLERAFPCEQQRRQPQRSL